MNKTVWMLWLQGKNHPSLPALNRVCIEAWTEMNPGWDVKVLDKNMLREYAPEFFEIKGQLDFSRAAQTRSDLARLILLSKFGGVWADASLLPMHPLDDWLPGVMNETGFFTYRFKLAPPVEGEPTVTLKRRFRKVTVSWFLAVDRPNHYLIDTWLDKFTESFLTLPRRLPVYHQVHADLAWLYDHDPKIKDIIEGMVSIDQQIPHSAQHKQGWDGRKPSFVYKRPRMNKQQRLDYKSSYLVDFKEKKN